MDVFSDFDSLGGIGDLKAAIGAMLTIILIVAVLMIIVSGIIWAIASSTGNPGLASKGKTGGVRCGQCRSSCPVRSRLDQLAQQPRRTTVSNTTDAALEIHGSM